MGDDSWLFILEIVVLFLLGGYFASAETALSAVSRVRIKNRADRGDRRAARVGEILDNFEKAISTILIGTNIVHICSASITTVFVTRHWGSGAVVYSTIITTIVVFFVCEMLPKSLARKYSERVSLAVSASMKALMWVLTPVTLFLSAIGKGAAKLTRGDGEVSVTEDELYDIIENLTEEGSLDGEKGDLVCSALEFDDVSAGDILTARVDVAGIDIETDIRDILEKIKLERHSRLPVYRGSLDNILGVLQIRKFIKAYMRQGEALELESLLDEPYFVHSSMKVDELLRELSRRKINLAFVTDSYGGTVGIVTVEDILEELVGEIWDEDDVVVENVIPLGGGAFDLDASMQVEEAFEEIGFENPEDDDLSHKSLGEWVYEQFDGIPAEGDFFEYNGLRVTVAVQRQRRIMRIRVDLSETEEKEADDE